MPLWSNEQWRACIGSSWCAIGRPFKCNSSGFHRGNMLQLTVFARMTLQYGFLMTVIAIITGYNLLSCRCRKAIKGNLHHTTAFVKLLMTVVLLLQAAMFVQTSLLMRSGDVERNPGPGTDLDYSSVDNETILGVDDIREVRKEIHTVTVRYHMLGIELGLRVEELDSIRRVYSQDLTQACSEMLLVWLRQSYRVDKYGLPTWRRLVEAVDNEAGGNHHALAKKIASNHPAELTECGTSTSEAQKMPYVPQPTLSRSMKKGDSAEMFEDTDEFDDTYVSSNSHKTPPLRSVGKSYSSATFPTPLRGRPKLRTMSCAGEDKPGPEVPTDDPTVDWASTIEKHRETLATYYKRQIDDRAWPPVKTTNFINLALIRDKSTWRRTLRGSIDKAIREKDTASYHVMFDDLAVERFILLEGRPGSGKTTLMSKISRDWACRDILSPFLLLLVPLRRLNNTEDRNIRTILQVAYPGLSKRDLEQLASHIEENHGEHVVFAFDGLDEYAPLFYNPITKLKEDLSSGTKRLKRRLTGLFSSNKEQKVDDIFQILCGKSLTKALVIVTSRPSACTEFREYAGKRIEVLGFLKPQITDYIHHYFGGDKEKAKQLMLHLEQRPNLMNMAYLPLHCAMLAFLYEEDTVLPETETEFYKFFTISTLLRDMRKRHGEVNCMKTFDDLSVSDKATFDKICQLAFTATANSKQVFSADDVRSLSASTNEDIGSFGLVVVDHCFTRYGLDDTYTFVHLTFQEYLAAVHIAGLSEDEHMELIRKHHKNKHLTVVWKFVCGMIDYTNPTALATFKSLSDTASAKDKLFPIQCCHESQSSLACNHIVRASKAQLKFNSTNFTPSDCMAIGYVIHEYDDELVHLVFRDCNISCEGAIALLQKVDDHPMTLSLKNGSAVTSFLRALAECTSPGLHHLLLSGNSLAYEGAELLGKSLHGCTNVLKLDLSDNKIGADGAQELADGLVSCTKLQELDLSKNSLTDEGIMALSSAIKEMENLRKLCLNKNEISSEGVEMLSEGMEALKNLQQLSLNKNSIDSGGAIALSQVVEEMTTLQCLDLNYNYIGKDGQEAISAATSRKGIKIHLNNQYSGM